MKRQLGARLPSEFCFGRCNQMKPLVRRNALRTPRAPRMILTYPCMESGALVFTFAYTTTQHRHGAALPLNDYIHDSTPDTRRYATPPRRTHARGGLARRRRLPRALCRADGEPLPAPSTPHALTRFAPKRHGLEAARVDYRAKSRDDSVRRGILGRRGAEQHVADQPRPKPKERLPLGSEGRPNPRRSPRPEPRPGPGAGQETGAARSPPLAINRSPRAWRRCAWVRPRVTRDDPRTAPRPASASAAKSSALRFPGPVQGSPEGRSCVGRGRAGVSPADARAAWGETVDGGRAAARVPASAVGRGAHATPHEGRVGSGDTLRGSESELDKRKPSTQTFELSRIWVPRAYFDMVPSLWARVVRHPMKLI